jgi:uncharacterized glyoxalase superfamily protein PhnB
MPGGEVTAPQDHGRRWDARLVPQDRFEVRGDFPDDEPTWCEVSRDGVVLQFLGGETPWPGPPVFTGTLYFHAEGVDAFFEQIKGHTRPAWGPEDREWGARELGLQDPNGYFITFTEPA